jgi:predicted dehydrogenase
MARLNWGMIGGGEGSQIGPAHRLGAQADGNFVLAAGALDRCGEGTRLCRTAGRGGGPRLWRLARDAGGRAEPRRSVDLVTVATPNSTHFEITKAFLEAGFTCCAKSR